MNVPSCITDFESEPLPDIQRHMKLAAKGFKPSKDSSLLETLHLVYVYYAYNKSTEIEQVSDYLETFVHPGEYRLWFGEIFCLQARVCREAGDTARATRYRQLIQTMNQNHTPAKLSDIEYANRGALVDMSKRSEEAWRIRMLYTICSSIEFGGTSCLSPERAEPEFQEHLANLRAILGIPQQATPSRTSKNTAVYPIRSLLFSNDYKIGQGNAAPTPTADTAVVTVDALGWVKCPNCGFRFNARDKAAFDGKKHKRCGKKMSIQFPAVP